MACTVLACHSSTFGPPSRQRFHPGHPKAAGRGGSAGGVVGTAYRVATIVQDSTGIYTVTLTNAMADTNYWVLVTAIELARPPCSWCASSTKPLPLPNPTGASASLSTATWLDGMRRLAQKRLPLRPVLGCQELRDGRPRLGYDCDEGVAAYTFDGRLYSASWYGDAACQVGAVAGLPFL